MEVNRKIRASESRASRFFRLLHPYSDSSWPCRGAKLAGSSCYVGILLAEREPSEGSPNAGTDFDQKSEQRREYQKPQRGLATECPEVET